MNTNKMSKYSTGVITPTLHLAQLLNELEPILTTDNADARIRKSILNGYTIRECGSSIKVCKLALSVMRHEEIGNATYRASMFPDVWKMYGLHGLSKINNRYKTEKPIMTSTMLK